MKKIVAILLVLLLIMTGCKTGDDSSKIDQGTYFPIGGDDDSSDKQSLNQNELKSTDLNDDQKVRWIGRTEYKNEERFMYYTGTGFEVNFKGTKLEVTFTATHVANVNKQPYFYVMVDDQTIIEATSFHLTNPNQTIVIVNGLENENHKVTVLKASEPYDSSVSVVSLKTDDSFYKISEFSGLKIQLLGASGLSGHGSLGQSGQSRTTANSSSLHAFGYLTARMFDADFQFISNSGSGLKWGSGTNMRTAYDYVGLDTGLNVIDTKWNHQSWIPDVLICNIGGNDFTSYVNKLTDQIAAKKEFREAVIEFLTYVHSLYPDLYIIWTHTGSSNGTQAEAAISDYKNRSKVKVVVIPKVGADGDPEGANGHNSIYTHIRTADILASAITELIKTTSSVENISWS